MQISRGRGHTVVLTDDGKVYTWGRGDDGRLGHGDNGWKFVPRLVEDLRDKKVRQVTCGSYHTAAVTGSINSLRDGVLNQLTVVSACS